MNRLVPRAGVLGIGLALVATSCIGGGGPAGAAGMVVSAIVGAVQARAHTDAAWGELREGEKLEPGSAIRVVPGGSVAIARGDSVVEIRPSETTPAEFEVARIEQLEVTAGDVLVSSTAQAPIAVSSAGISARTDEGIFRFDRRLSLRVGVYEGTTTVASAGTSLALPRLRESVIAGRIIPREPAPLAIRASDPWDVRLLRDVIDLDRDLAAQRRGYEAQFGRRTTVSRLEDSFRVGLGIGGLGFTRASLSTLRSGDVLIGLVLASIIEAEGRDRASRVYEASVELLGAGASWGLIAHEYDVAPDTLLGGVVRAVGVRTGEVRSRPGVIAGGGSGGRASGGGGNGGGNGGSGGNGGGGSTPTASPKPKPTPTKKSTPTPDPSPEPTDSETPEPEPCFPGPPPLCFDSGR